MDEYEKEACLHVSYEIFAEQKEYEGYGNVIVYGIRGIDEFEKKEIPAISTNYYFVERLMGALKKYGVSIVHMADVITDALFERELAYQ